MILQQYQAQQLLPKEYIVRQMRNVKTMNFSILFDFRSLLICFTAST